MKHRPWPLTARLVARMADSSLLDTVSLDSLQREPRSEGLHASELLHALHPVKDDSKVSEEQLRVYGLLGLAFEDRCELALLSLAKEDDWPYDACRPGEVFHDGIAMSPDILLLSKADNSIRELSIKVAWKSCREWPTTKPGYGEFPSEADYYLDQTMTYATPLKTLEGILFVYFVNGDWRIKPGIRTPPIPQVHGWELAFTEQERSETWQALLNLKRIRA